MTLYIKESENAIEKLLEMIKTFIKVAEYRINTEKSVAFLCQSTQKNQ